MPISEFGKLSSHCIYRAINYLYAAIITVPTDLDIFAANLLGWIAYSTCSKEIDASVHFKGSMAVLSFILKPVRSRIRPISEILKTFGPFVLDCANAWATRHGIIPHRCTKFERRVKYFDELRRFENSGMWYTGILEAANATLGNLLEVSLSCVCQLAKREKELDFNRDNVDAVLQYVRAEIGDIDLHHALVAIDQSFQGEQTNHTTVEGQLITRLFHRARCVLLLITILEQDSIQNGVTASEVRYLARILVSCCWSHLIQRDGTIEDYYLISWHNFSHLLLGGMALQA
jgi:hypothetical protein